MISVVIAAYNTEKYIAKCLESLQKQTYTDFEVIVVVDGATDKTLMICEEFSKRDRRFIPVYRRTAALPLQEIPDWKNAPQNTSLLWTQTIMWIRITWSF